MFMRRTMEAREAGAGGMMSGVRTESGVKRKEKDLGQVVLTLYLIYERCKTRTSNAG